MKSPLLGAGGDCALADQERVGEFAECEPERERGGGEDSGAVERAAERFRERRVRHRMGRRRVHRPIDARALHDPAHHFDPVETVDPRHVLPARSERSAREPPERRDHLRERSPRFLEHEPGAQQDDADAAPGGGLRGVLPLDAEPREKIIARRRRFRQRLVAVRAVVSDPAAADEDRGRRRPLGGGTRTRRA